METLKLQSGYTKAYLKAFTLIETLIAMVIIMLSFGFAVSLYYNILNTSNSRQLVNAQLNENVILNKTLLKDDLLDTTFNFPAMTINRKISSYPSGNNLSVVELDAYDLNGKQISTQKEIIINR